MLVIGCAVLVGNIYIYFWRCVWIGWVIAGCQHRKTKIASLGASDMAAGVMEHFNVTFKQTSASPRWHIL